MLVYGSLAISGMVLLGYDSGFQPSLAFFWMSWYFGMLILVLSFVLSDGFQNPWWRWSHVSFSKA